MRTCADCPADISDRKHNAKRCVPCAKRWRAGIANSINRGRYCTDPEFRQWRIVKARAEYSEHRQDVLAAQKLKRQAAHVRRVMERAAAVAGLPVDVVRERLGLSA